MHLHDLHYSPSTGVARVLAVVVASVVTGSLFGAVAFGLTGDGTWSVFAIEGTSVLLSAGIA